MLNRLTRLGGARACVVTSRAAILVVIGAAGCTKATPPARPKVSVTIAVAERASAPYVVTANGLIEPMQSVAVQSQVQGVLMSVHFREGDEVKAGDILMQIDPRPFRAALDQARAVLARDVAQADNARRDADRYAALVAKDFVTRSQADQAAANATAQMAVVKADSAAVANAQFNLDNATIRAPISGKTGSVFVRQGNLVRPGTVPPLVVINQIHPILARFAVPERELARVQAYAKQHALRVTATTARAAAGSAAGTTAGVVGSLNFIDNGVDSTTGAVTLKARFDNADNSLWPGQFVAIELELFVEPSALLVPTTAVQPAQDGGQFVYALDADNKAKIIPVTAGRTVGDLTVIEKGLEAGTRVVTDGQSRLTPGAAVEVHTAGGPTTPGSGVGAGATANAPGKATAGDSGRAAPPAKKAP